MRDRELQVVRWLLPILLGLSPVTAVAQNSMDFAPFRFVDGVPNVVLLDGLIDLRTPLAFRRAMTAYPNTHTIVLNSVGGSVQAGLLLAEDVFERGMNTIILSEMQCLSACALIYFAGKERMVEGKLGVHQISGSDDIEVAQLNLSDILETLAKYGVSQEVITRMLRTRPDEMYVFSPEEIVGLGINRTGPRVGADTTKLTSPPDGSDRKQSSTDDGAQPELAKGFVLGLILSGSLPPNDLIGMAQNVYADTVEFYGKKRSKAEVLADKKQYAERWPNRVSTARPASVTVNCRGDVCRVTGIYDWSVSNAARKKHLKGSATFEYIVWMGSRGSYRIVAENGEVLERFRN